ncbi:calcium-binding protein, partial [Streptomyces sp. SID10244]|nr:calcium-binding protein [Streptomyces sp. SID10244]
TSQTKGTSKEFQGKFASGVDALVVGKNIDDLDVHKVSGSSLTSTGFNDAIDQIKTEAQA